MFGAKDNTIKLGDVKFPLFDIERTLLGSPTQNLPLVLWLKVTLTSSMMGLQSFHSLSLKVMLPLGNEPQRHLLDFLDVSVRVILQGKFDCQSSLELLATGMIFNQVF
ncbi:MAG: hypothetical protein BRC37_06520 [Cyanobacteria bacterium QH_3_48_40]|nr:MAG: hypothetical protein BRC37_06520 [Cyanobacteria bacterium QH_3_48_40]